MGRRPKKFSQDEIAKYMIISKKHAELFIKRWMELHNTCRETALAKLRELGIEFTQLPD